MRLALAAVVLSSVATAQTAYECNGTACVGRSGQPVNLGGTISVNQGPWPDGGLARMSPVVSGVPIELRGNQSRTSTSPDVILSAANARDGGVPIVSIQTNGVTVASFSGSGVLTATGFTPTGGSVLGKFDIVDAGVLNVQGQATVAGPIIGASTASGTTASFPSNGSAFGFETTVGVDAGSVRVQGVYLPTASAIDGGAGTQPRIQWGNATLSSNANTVVFNPAFSTIPMCVCSSTNATAAACDASATSVSQTVLKGANASDVVMWICVGDK